MGGEPGRVDASRMFNDRSLTRRKLMGVVAAAGVGLVDRFVYTRQTQAQQAPAGVGTATVNSSDGLNLRGGPGENYPIVTVMPSGAQVTITGATTPDNWVPVQYNGQSGWADGVYLTNSGNSAGNSTNASAAPAQTTATVTPADGLNLRGGPGTDQAVIIVIPGGATVTVLDAATNGWVPVTYGGRAGWVEAGYLGTGGTGGTGSASGASTAATPSSGTTITAAASSSTAGATLAPAGAAAAGTSTAFGSAAMGIAAPPERGLAAVPAPAGALGRFVWPVDSRQITTVFQPAHQALDIAQALNSPVRAIADAIVSFAGGDATRSYGLYVILQHADGYSSLYAHLSTIGVQQGQVVKRGQEIGRTGVTGRSTGPHIHFAIYYQGMPLDPLTVLANDGVQIMAGANDVA